jgi:hypothetical protein
MTTDAQPSVIRVLIADDQALVRRGFRMVLEFCWSEICAGGV